MKTKTIPTWCVFLIAAGFGIAGLLVFLNGMDQIFLSLKAGSWSSVPALVENVSKDYTFVGGRTPGRTLTINPVYSYEYEGKSYLGTKIHPSYLGSNAYKIQNALFNKLNQAKQTRKKILARVNPDDPQEAYLATKFDITDLALPIFSLPFMACGFVLFMAAWGSRKGRKRMIADYLERRMTLPGS